MNYNVAEPFKNHVFLSQAMKDSSGRFKYCFCLKESNFHHHPSSALKTLNWEVENRTFTDCCTQHFYFIPLQKQASEEHRYKQTSIQFLPKLPHLQTELFAKQKEEESFESQRKMFNISTVHFHMQQKCNCGVRPQIMLRSEQNGKGGGLKG